MPRENGEFWISGTALHFIDGAGDEWQYQGDDQGPAGAGREQGEIWFTNGADTINYVDRNGRHRTMGTELDNSPEAVQGDIWIRHDDGEGSKIIFVTDSAVTTTPHTNYTPTSHTNTTSHRSTGSSNRDHTDTGHSDFGNTHKTDYSHTDEHGDYKTDFTDNFTDIAASHTDRITRFSHTDFSDFSQFSNFNNHSNFSAFSNHFSAFSAFTAFGNRHYNHSNHGNHGNFSNGWWSEEDDTVGGPAFDSFEADEKEDDGNPSTAPMGHTDFREATAHADFVDPHVDTSDHTNSHSDYGPDTRFSNHTNFSFSDNHNDHSDHSNHHTNHAVHTNHTNQGSHEDEHARPV